MNIFKQIHQKLLPQYPDIGYMPYVWLSYLAMFFLNFFVQTLSNQQLIIGLASVLVFLILYFRMFWVVYHQVIYYIAGVWLIGQVLAIQDFFFAGVFYVYAGAFCVQFNKPKVGFLVLGLMVILNIVVGYLFEVSPYVYLPSSFFAIVIGTSNMFMHEMSKKNKQIKASQEEIKKIAISAERERIARDLHDLIGHTFSVINIKSQLARKLIERDADKAAKEINEIEKISRSSLSQIREVVSDYRKRDLTTELSQARLLLESLEIPMHADITTVDELNLSPEQNTTLAYIVRELTTNIMRHGKTTDCTLKLASIDHHLVLSMHNSGDFKTFSEGSGLKGIRERTEQLGGHATFKINHGFDASIKIPLT